jgi:hypothetical protein
MSRLWRESVGKLKLYIDKNVDVRIVEEGLRKR